MNVVCCSSDWCFKGYDEQLSGAVTTIFFFCFLNSRSQLLKERVEIFSPFCTQNSQNSIECNRVKNRPHVGKATCISSREANRKSQKLFLFAEWWKNMAAKSIHLRISSFNLKGKQFPSRGRNSSLYKLPPTSPDKRAYLVTIREKFTVFIRL